MGEGPTSEQELLDEAERLRKRVEELRENEESFRRALKNSPTLVFSQDRDLRYTWIYNPNPNFNDEEIIGRTDYDLVPKEQADRLTKVKREVIDTGKGRRFDFRVDLKGEEFIYDMTIEPLRDESGRVAGISCSATDVTASRKAVDTLKGSEEKYRMLFEEAIDAIFVADPETGVISGCNQKAEELTGWPREKLIGMHQKRLHPPVEQDGEFSSTFRKHRAENEGGILEAQIQTASGEIRDVEIKANVFELQGKRLIQGIFRDVTEKRKAEEGLRKSEEKYRLVVNHIDEIIYSLKTEEGDLLKGRVDLVSERVRDILGYDRDEFLNDRTLWFSIIHPDDRQKAAESTRKIISSGKPGSRRYRLRHKETGEYRLFEDKTVPEFAPDGKLTGMSGVARDVTEQSRMEEEMIRARKLESLGVLAGGIAHDFNNLLTGIISNISLATMLIDSKEKALKVLAESERAALRAQGLTQQLLTFARGGAPVKKTISMGELVRESADFVLKGSNVRCEYDMPEGLWPVDADEGQIAQVVHNLVMNADQAMPDGGVIKIKAENFTAGDGTDEPLEPGRYVRLTISDRGVGVPLNVIEKIFDPYFSTKKKGSGLGLATCYSIIKKHGGHITAESTPGDGASFHVFIPASSGKAPGPERRPAASSMVRGKGRLLVMDDEELILRVAGDIPKAAGYEVELTADGKRAIEAYERAAADGRPFDAVIMDLTVPGGMGGKEAIGEVLRLDPGARVLVSSGYSNDPVMSEYERYGFAGVIAKPYRPAELSGKVAEVLSAGRA